MDCRLASVLGPLINFIGHLVLANLAFISLPLLAPYVLPKDRKSNAAEQINIMLCAIPLPILSSSSDHYVWQVNDQHHTRTRIASGDIKLTSPAVSAIILQKQESTSFFNASIVNNFGL